MIVCGESQRRRVNTDGRAGRRRQAERLHNDLFPRPQWLSLPLAFNETLSLKMPSKSIVRLNLDNNRGDEVNRKWPPLPETVRENGNRAEYVAK